MGISSLKVASALAAAAVVVAGATFAQRTVASGDGDIVRTALHAPQPDVGVPPADVTLHFWEMRMAESPHDYASATSYAGALLGVARKTGDLSLYPRAEAVARQVLQTNPDYEPALLALASARGANHDFAAARSIAEAILARNPASQAALAVRADADFELGNYDLARRELDELSMIAPNEPSLVSRVAKQQAIAGDAVAAARSAARAVVAVSAHDYSLTDAAFFRFQLAYFLYQAGQVDRAGEAVTAALRIDPEHLPSLELQAKILVARNQLERAASVYESVIRRGPAADIYGDLAKV